MKPPRPLPGGALEYAVMVALWDLGSASVRSIHARVGTESGLVYTTTAKVLDRLHLKGLVARQRAGKAFLYRPSVKRQTLERARAKDFLGRLFGDDPAPAMSTLVDAVEDIDPSLLRALTKAVDARRRKRRG